MYKPFDFHYDEIWWGFLINFCSAEHQGGEQGAEEHKMFQGQGNEPKRLQKEEKATIE